MFTEDSSCPVLTSNCGHWLLEGEQGTLTRNPLSFHDLVSSLQKTSCSLFRGQNWQDGPEEISVYALLGHNKASLSWTCPLLLGTSSKNQLADYLLSAVCTWQTLANGRPEGPGLSTNRRRRCSSHTQRNVSARSSLAPRSLAPRMDCLVRRVRGWKNSVRDGLSPQSRAGVTQVRSYIGNSWHPAWSTLLLRNLSCNSVHCVLLHRLTRLPEKEPYCK